MQDKYADVFEDKLGTFKSAKAKLPFKEDSQAHFCKASAVPCALCLETYGWRRTEKTLEWRYSHERWVEWLGNAHCTCPKERWIFQDLWWLQRRSKPRTTSWAVSLAPPVKISLQSLPGQTFSKIDLRQAYHKLEMEEDSKKYLTINTHMGLF